MAVGFEFETWLQVFQISAEAEAAIETEYRKARQDIRLGTLNKLCSKLEADRQLRYFPKNTVLYRDAVNGWKAVADGADIEFVTDPFTIEAPSEQSYNFFGEDTYQSRLKGLEDFVGRLDAFRTRGFRPTRSPWIVRGDDANLFRQFPPFVIKWGTSHDTAIAGFPQVTGGIRLSRLRKLFKFFAANAGDENTRGLLGGSPSQTDAYVKFISRVATNLKAKRLRDPRWDTHTPTAELRGLLTMIAAYLDRGSPQGAAGAPIKVVKHLFFVMARTNFARMFSQIDIGEQAHYVTRPDDWVEFVCDTVMREVAGRRFDPGGLVIEYKITDYGQLKGEDRAEIPITRKDWLVGMTLGTDLLSEKTHPLKGDALKARIYTDVHGEHRLRGLGALGDAMDHFVVNGLQVDEGGAIFEFRGPGHDHNMIPYPRWGDFAMKMFRFLAAMNTHAKRENIDVAGLSGMWDELQPISW